MVVPEAAATAARDTGASLEWFISCVIRGLWPVQGMLCCTWPHEASRPKATKPQNFKTVKPYSNTNSDHACFMRRAAPGSSSSSSVLNGSRLALTLMPRAVLSLNDTTCAGAKGRHRCEFCLWCEPNSTNFIVFATPIPILTGALTLKDYLT